MNEIYIVNMGFKLGFIILMVWYTRGNIVETVFQSIILRSNLGNIYIMSEKVWYEILDRNERILYDIWNEIHWKIRDDEKVI